MPLLKLIVSVGVKAPAVVLAILEVTFVEMAIGVVHLAVAILDLVVHPTPVPVATLPVLLALTLQPVVELYPVVLITRGVRNDTITIYFTI